MDDVRVTDEVTVGLRELNRLAKVLRSRRAARGALQLASPEVKFKLDSETLDPLDVGEKTVALGHSSLGSCSVAVLVPMVFSAMLLLLSFINCVVSLLL